MSTPSYKQTLSGALEVNQFYVTRPSKLLLKLNQEEFSGKVIIQNPHDDFVTWYVYLGKGKIHYATSSIGWKERCHYLINHHGFGDILDFRFSKDLTKDYDYFYKLWKDKAFTFEQSRAIFECLTSEALLHILALPYSRCILITEADLPSPILNLDINQNVVTLRHKVRCWSSLKPDINSPFQRPLVNDWSKAEKIIREYDKYNERWSKKLYDSLSKLCCIYDIANRTQTNVLDLSILFGKLIKAGQGTMLSYQEIVLQEQIHVVYVDDHPVTQRIVRYSLEQSDFRVTVISEPHKALITLQNQKVDLIIMSTEMKEIDGFQLTKICRQLPELNNLPIVLIIEAKKNLVHEIKAKMSGTSGYLRKPFLPQELIATVKKYLPEKLSTTWNN